MDLKAYLQLACQLVDKKQAEVKIQGYRVKFETTSHGWQISTSICSKKQVPLSLLNSIALSRFSFLEKQGIFLKRSSLDGTLVLSKKTTPLNDFEAFEKEMTLFIKLCDEWKGLLQEEEISSFQFSLK
jgi:hypothetical protein